MKFHVYRAGKDKCRWRLVAGNGELVADSGQVFDRKEECEEAIAQMRGAGKHRWARRRSIY